ncbi:MAG TPA: class D sortase [Bryobacteraceae bacterium]|jgi:sortase A|nr:class D sortase [Bryobacteraceae bacterium]
MKVILRSQRSWRWLRWAKFGFLAAGVAMVGYSVAVILQVRSYQSRAAETFDRQLRQAPRVEATPAPPPTVVPPPPRVGAVLGRLKVPRLGLSVMVIEGAGSRQLKRAAGHIPGTALPGEAGNVAIAAHRDTFFYPLRGIRRNDTIDVVTLQTVKRYRVDSTEVVSPNDVQVLAPVGHDVLTLVTCFPFNYIGAAPKRFIVRAERVD